eukprot:RCo047486
MESEPKRPHAAEEVSLEDVLQALGKQTEVIYTLTPSSTVAAALEVLGERGILSAPVVSANKEFLGIVDLVDILDLVLETFEKSADVHGLGSCSIADALARVRAHRRQDVAFLAARLNTRKSLAQVVRTKLLPYNHHRIAINDCDSVVVELFSQSDVIRYLAANPSYMEEVMAQTLEQLQLAKPAQAVRFVTGSTPVIEAFRMMSENEVGGVAVEDSSGRLLTEFSVEALRGLGARDFPHLLSKPVAEFLRAERQFHVPHVEHVPPVCCAPTDTLRSVVEKLVDASARRAYILEPSSGKVTGVVSLSDVLRAVFGVCVCMCARSWLCPSIDHQFRQPHQAPLFHHRTNVRKLL